MSVSQYHTWHLRSPSGSPSVTRTVMVMRVSSIPSPHRRLLKLHLNEKQVPCYSVFSCQWFGGKKYDAQTHPIIYSTH